MSWNTSLIVSDKGLVSGKAVDVTSENNCHSKVHYFDFLVSCLYTFNPLSLSLKWVITLVETTYREKRGERDVQRDSYQADEIVMEFEEWKQNIADDYVKSFSRILLGVLETSILS